MVCSTLAGRLKDLSTESLVMTKGRSQVACYDGESTQRTLSAADDRDKKWSSGFKKQHSFKTKPIVSGNPRPVLCQSKAHGSKSFHAIQWPIVNHLTI